MKSRRTLGTALVGIAFLSLSCAHGPAGRGPAVTTAPMPDSATVALWRMDEPGGFTVADDGPLHLTAYVGADVRAGFGRFRGARTFTRSIDSFLFVPYSDSLETGTELTVEAWISPNSLANTQFMPILGRWSPISNQQSWLFGIVGLNLPSTGTPPGFAALDPLVSMGSPGHLVFGIQPADAGFPASYFSTEEIRLGRWTHVAVTYDSREVRFYIDGQLDSQYAFGQRIRPTGAPLMIGNFFDSRWITDLGTQPRVGSGADRTAFYAFDGSIDELMISRTARTTFGSPR